MPKRYRLSRAEFTLLLKQKSRRVHGSYFSAVFYTLPPLLRGPRFASVVSKKVAQSAARRNLVERRARSIAKKYISSVDSGLGIVLHAKKDTTRATFQELESDIQTLFERSH